LSSPKRHHYLPQCYLDNFCRDGGLFLYDRKLDEFRSQTPINTAVSRYYYAYEDAAGEKNVEVEKALAEIEGIAIKLIQKLDNNELIGEYEKGQLSMFVALMMNRVPDFENTVNSIMDKAASLLGKDRDEKLQPHDRLAMMLSVSERIAHHFLGMDWVILHSPAKSSFITSDSPVAIKATKPGDGLGTGITTPGAEKIFPLTQSSCLLMLEPGELMHHAKVAQRTVRRVNLQVAANCDRYVIARDKRLVENLVSSCNLAGTERYGRVVFN
jgi:hypothetical protein